jgi:hypothetical protein
MSLQAHPQRLPARSPLIQAVAVGLLTAAAFGISVGVITGAIDTPIFERATPAYAIDYPIWALNALLVGALAGVSMFAIRQRRDFGTGPIYAGGFLSAFAISCPLCNGLLVAAFGTGVAANVFDPARPFIGGATALFMAYVLYRRIRTLRAGCDDCEVVAEPSAN